MAAIVGTTYYLLDTNSYNIYHNLMTNFYQKSL